MQLNWFAYLILSEIIKITMVLAHAGSAECLVLITSRVLLTAALCVSAVTVPIYRGRNQASQGRPLLTSGARDLNSVREASLSDT